MPDGPKWCEVFLILYRTPYSTKLKVNKTDAVTVCPFRIFTFEQITLNPVTVAKHLVVLTVLGYSCVVIFTKNDPTHHNNNCSGQYTEIVTGHYFSIVGLLGCQLTYYAKLRPLAVCIHKEGSNLCKV